MKRLLLLIMVFCLHQYEGFSQNLEFDSEGKLLIPPPKKVRKNSKWNLEIRQDDKAVQKEMDSIIKIITIADTMASSINFTYAEKLLAEELKNIRCFLLEYQKTDSTCIDTWILGDELFQSYLVMIPDIAITTNVSYQSDCYTPECFCELAKIKSRRLVEIQTMLYDYYNKRRLIAEFLCDVPVPKRDSIFKFNKKNTIYQFIPDFIDTGYDYLIGNQKFRKKKEEDSISYFEVTYTTSHKAAFNIVRRNRFSELFMNWHNKTASILNKIDLDTLYRKIISDTETIFGLEKQLQDGGSCNPEKEKSLDSLLNKLKGYDSIWCPTSAIVSYLKSWIWIGNGDFKLNYLNLTDAEFNKSIQEQHDSMIVVQKNLEELNAKIDSLKKCLSCKIANNKTILDTLRILQDSAYKISIDRKATIEKISSLKKQIDANAKKLNNFQSINKVIHSLNIAGPDALGIQRIIYHDASDGWEMKNRLKFPFNLNKGVILPDVYSVYYGIYNAAITDTSIKIIEEKLVFNDSAKAMQELNQAITGLAEAAAPLVPFVVPGSQFIRTFSKRTSGSGLESLNDTIIPKSEDPCESLVQQINYRLWQFKLLLKLLADYKQLPTPGYLKPSTDNTPVYFTFTKRAKEFESPYTNKYTFTNQDIPVNYGRYSVGRQKTLTLGAGIFYSESTVRQQEVDTSGGGFTVRNLDDRARFVIGVKVFPFKAFEADGSLIPRFPHKRFSLFGGFEITRPLQNLYAGVGYDIVPGLQFSYGMHIYRSDYFRIQNNQVIDKTSSYKRSGAYYGVTIDPVVLTGLLKVLFK